MGQPGQELAGLLLDRLLGQGVLGESWLARPTGEGAPVVVKLLMERAFIEALQEAPEQLLPPGPTDPRIVAPQQAGIAEGQPYLLFPYQTDESLAHMLRDGPVPTTWVARILGQLLQLLKDTSLPSQAALHGDLKPENLFIGNDGGIRLTDFGQAELVRRIAPEAYMLHLFGRVIRRDVVLPFRYQSNERRAGEGPTVASEIYSLGAVALHLLDGGLRWNPEQPAGVPDDWAHWISMAAGGTFQTYQAALEALPHEQDVPAITGPAAQPPSIEPPLREDADVGLDELADELDLLDGGWEPELDLDDSDDLADLLEESGDLLELVDAATRAHQLRTQAPAEANEGGPASWDEASDGDLAPSDFELAISDDELAISDDELAISDDELPTIELPTPPPPPLREPPPDPTGEVEGLIPRFRGLETEGIPHHRPELEESDELPMLPPEEALQLLASSPRQAPPPPTGTARAGLSAWLDELDEVEAGQPSPPPAREPGSGRTRQELEARKHKQRELAARKRQEEEARKRRAEEARKRQAAEAQKRQAAEAQKRQEMEARRQQEAEARKQQEAEARKQQEAAARKQQEAAARKQQEAAARKQQEAAARKQQELAAARRMEELEAASSAEVEKGQGEITQALKTSRRLDDSDDDLLLLDDEPAMDGPSAEELEALDPLEALALLAEEHEDRPSTAKVKLEQAAEAAKVKAGEAPTKAEECGLIISGLGISRKREKAAELIAGICQIPLEKARSMAAKPVVTVLRSVDRKVANDAFHLFKEAGITARVTFRRPRK